MEKIKTYESFLDGEKIEIFESKLEGIVTEIQKITEKESIFKVKTEKNEEIISVPFKIHEKILLGSRIFYCKLEEYKKGFEISDYVFGTEGPEPIGRSYKKITNRYFIKIRDGEFEGIEYDKIKSKIAYLDEEE